MEYKQTGPKKRENVHWVMPLRLAGLWKATWLLPATGICAAALSISDDLVNFRLLFFLFLSRPTIVIFYWPWSIGSLAASGGWCNGCWCCDGCDASWWAACWPALRCDGWFGLTPSRSRVTKDRIVRALLNTLHRRINTGNNYCVHSREQHYRHIYVTIQL